MPDGGGADLVAESGEFAVDAPVAPGGVLGGETDGQGTQMIGRWDHDVKTESPQAR